jgi:hypothetical protein
VLHYEEGHKKQYEQEIISECETVIPGIYYAPIAFGYLAEASLYSNNFDKFGNLMKLDAEQKRAFLDALQRCILAENILSGNVADVTSIDKTKLGAIEDIIKIGKNIERMFQIFRETCIKV